MCPYHGFRYNCDGKCTVVPAHPTAKISPKLKLIVYPSVERYGLIWTTLGGGGEELIPDFPADEDREMVESQTPEDLPLDLHAEAHIPADRTSIAYRQLLTELGLGRNYTS